MVICARSPNTAYGARSIAQLTICIESSWTEPSTSSSGCARSAGIASRAMPMKIAMTTIWSMARSSTAPNGFVGMSPMIRSGTEAASMGSAASAAATVPTSATLSVRSSSSGSMNCPGRMVEASTMPRPTAAPVVTTKNAIVRQPTVLRNVASPLDVMPMTMDESTSTTTTIWMSARKTLPGSASQAASASARSAGPGAVARPRALSRPGRAVSLPAGAGAPATPPGYPVPGRARGRS